MTTYDWDNFGKCWYGTTTIVDNFHWCIFQNFYRFLLLHHGSRKISDLSAKEEHVFQDIFREGHPLDKEEHHHRYVVLIIINWVDSGAFRGYQVHRCTRYGGVTKW